MIRIQEYKGIISAVLNTDIKTFIKFAEDNKHTYEGYNKYIVTEVTDKVYTHTVECYGNLFNYSLKHFEQLYKGISI